MCTGTPVAALYPTLQLLVSTTNRFQNSLVQDCLYKAFDSKLLQNLSNVTMLPIQLPKKARKSVLKFGLQIVESND